MTVKVLRLAVVSALTIATGVLVAKPSGQSVQQGQSDRSGDWVYYGGDARNWRYKPFDQVNSSNFGTLQVAWRFRTDNLGPALDFRLGATPIMANGVV